MRRRSRCSGGYGAPGVRMIERLYQCLIAIVSIAALVIAVILLAELLAAMGQ